MVLKKLQLTNGGLGQLGKDVRTQSERPEQRRPSLKRRTGSEQVQFAPELVAERAASRTSLASTSSATSRASLLPPSPGASN